MLHLMKQDEYPAVLPIFEGLEHHLAIRAIIGGISPGRVYADDCVQPRTALIWNESHRFFLAGQPNDQDSFRSISSLITNEITPLAIRRRINVFVLYFSSDLSRDRIEAMLEDVSPSARLRSFYVFRKPRVNRSQKIPRGFPLKKVDRRLFARDDLKNIEKVEDEIRLQWRSVDSFLGDGFGFCLLRGTRVVGWCLSEYNNAGNCEIGVETSERYRRQGFATVTASALLDHCISKSVEPRWHCWTNNLPSTRLAEKLGFQKKADYLVYLWEV